jgi:cation transport ATPase
MQNIDAQRLSRVLGWAGVLPFAALGWITPIWAAVGMSLSSLLVVLNALRLSHTPNM